MIEGYRVRFEPNNSRTVCIVRDPAENGAYNILSESNTTDATLQLTFDNSEEDILVSTVLDPIADSAYTIYTQSNNSDVELYLTLVDSDNIPASKETLYTNYGLTYNPSTKNLSIGSSIQISPNMLIYSPTSFYIGNGSNTGITSFSGKIRIGGNNILSSSGDTVVSFAGTNTDFKGNVAVLGNLNINNVNAGTVTATKFVGDGSGLTGITFPTDPFIGKSPTIVYDTQGRVESIIYSNGSIKTLTYDVDGKLTQSNHTSGSQTLQKIFTYDVQERLVNISEVIT
jgi:YD repeat-containing protein